MSPTPASDRTAGRGTVSRAVGDRRNTRGETTRQLILDTAERLFAERGVAAVPLRDIGIAAGQRNHAAVQYHFGDRDQVVTAIMERRGAESELRRAELVAHLLVSGTAPTIPDAVDAFVRPLAIHIRPDNHYLGFLSLFITEEGGYEGLEGVHTGSSVITLRALVGRLAPQVPEAVLDERWWLTLTSAVHALARYQAAQQKRAQLPAPIDVLIDDLVGYLSAGLVAQVGPLDPRAPSS